MWRGQRFGHFTNARPQLLVWGMRLVTAAIFGLLVVLACEGPATKPPEGPGTEYPCGIRGISCHNGNCCWIGEECNVPTCPEGMCCYVGDETTLGSSGKGHPVVGEQFSPPGR